MVEGGAPGVAAIFDDPVALAAPVAHRLAGLHCGADPVTGETCAWYHGARLYIRALDTGQCALPPSHQAFFETEFLALARTAGPLDILVSGSADYVMPALILNAFQSTIAPRVTVVDLCATPLYLMDWYAERHGVTIATRHSDVLDMADEAAFDIVATHHLFNYFAPGMRASLVDRWRRLLRPGGRLVVVNRFGSPGRIAAGHTASGRAAFTEATIASARERGAQFPLPDGELAEMVQNYRARIRAFCLDSAEELPSLLSNAGFLVERHDILSQTRRVKATSATGEEKADAVGVVARRL